MSNGSIFRKEAVEYQKSKWTGNALLLSGFSAWVIPAICSGFIIILVLAIISGSYTRRINVAGEVITQPRAINLYASNQGIISQSFVQIGDVVSKGTRLYEIDISRVTSSGNVSDNVITAIKSQIIQTTDIIAKLQDNKSTTLENLQQQIEQYSSSQVISNRLVKDAREGMSVMKGHMKNYTEFQRKGLINKDQENNQRYLYYQQQSTYHTLYSQSIQEQLQITNLKSDLVTRAADFDNQISQYEYQRDDLKRQLAEAEANSILLINAPTDGTVESLSVTLGQMVNINDSLAQIIPEGGNAYYLVLWIPNSSVPYLRIGDPINVRYEAFPFEKFGQFSGSIESISSVPASLQEMSTYNSVPSSMSGGPREPYYKAIIKLDHRQFTYQERDLMLSSGMKAQATVFLEKRPIYQWMLSPFYNIKKSLMGPISE